MGRHGRGRRAVTHSRVGAMEDDGSRSHCDDHTVTVTHSRSSWLLFIFTIEIQVFFTY